MNTNIGLLDRCIRFLVSANILISYHFQFIQGRLAYLLLVYALVLLVTVITKYTPCYDFFKINTLQPFEREIES